MSRMIGAGHTTKNDVVDVVILESLFNIITVHFNILLMPTYPLFIHIHVPTLLHLRYNIANCNGEFIKVIEPETQGKP